MAEATTVIDIIATVTDETAQGANSAISNVTKLEKSMQNLQKQILGMKGKSKLEVKAELKDMASKGLQAVADKGKQIAGKVWTVTLKAVDLVTAPFKKVWELVSNPVTQMAAFAGLSLGIGDAINTFKNFEAGMSQVSAVSGATGVELDRLTEKAREMGKSTKFTSTEAAEAFNYMAMAGWKTGEMLDGIEPILNLAAASGEELGTTSDIVTDALTGFGLTAQDAGHFADVLAVASSNANTNVGMMGETFKYVAPIAGSLGVSAEDTAEAVGLMANSGIKASQAGTSLRSILTRLATDAGASSKSLGALGVLTEELGVEFYDAQGNTRNFTAVLDEARVSWKKLSDEQKATFGKKIAGQEGISAWSALMEASEKDIKKLRSSIEDCDGASKNMADTMLDNLGGSLTLLQSAFGGLQETIGSKLSPYIRGFADWLTERMPDIEKAAGSAVDFITGKIDELAGRVKDMLSSTEWKDAGTVWEKLKIAWDKLIAEPFGEWWNGKGKAWLSGMAQSIGNGIGTALHTGIMAILGVDISGTVQDGAGIGRSFAEGFLDGFNGEEVGKAIAGAIISGMKSLVSDAAKLLPGGEKATATSGISAAILGAGALKAASGAYSLYKGGKAFFGGAGTLLSGIAEGAQLYNAAQGGGAAAQSAIAMAQQGGMGARAMIGSRLAGLAGNGSLGAGAATAVGAGAVAGGVIGGAALISGINDWITSDKARQEGDKEKSGAYMKSGGFKLGGVATGAAAGAAIGSVVPVVGTAAGALIGAGIGGVAGWVAGKKAVDDYEKAVTEAEKAEAELSLKRTKLEAIGSTMGKARFQTEGLAEALEDSSVSAGEFNAMFNEAVTQKINDSFGNVKLSMQEIKDIAKSIVLGSDLGAKFEGLEAASSKAGQSLSAFKSSFQDMEKETWYVTIKAGAKLTEGEQESFKSSVTDFVNNAISYVESKHYEATVSMELIMGEGRLAAGIDSLYGSLQEQVAQKAQELQDVLQKALEDGSISTERITLPDGTLQLSEADEIANLQNQISEITNKLAAAESEASMKALKIKYGGANLDAESFAKLQSELQEQLESSIANYDNALTIDLTNLELQLSEGTIDQRAYDRQVQDLTENYSAKIESLNAEVEKFQLDTIAEAFGSDLENALEEARPGIEGTVSEKLQEIMETAMAVEPDAANWSREQVSQWFGLESLDSEMQAAIGDTLKGVAKTVPESVKKQLEAEMDGLGFEEAAEKLKSTLGTDIASAIEGTDLSDAYNGITTLRELVENDAKTKFAEPIDVGTITVTGAYNWNISNQNPPAPNSGRYRGIVPEHAEGGFITAPELSWVGEDGPEAIIPLGSKRRKRGLELYKQAGKILGVGENASGGIWGIAPAIEKAGQSRMDAWDHPQTPEPSDAPDPQLPIPQPQQGGGGAPAVTIGNITFDIDVDGGAQDPQSLADAIRENIRGMTDEIAYQIAVALQQAFANTPKYAWGG